MPQISVNYVCVENIYSIVAACNQSEMGPNATKKKQTKVGHNPETTIESKVGRNNPTIISEKWVQILRQNYQ